MYNFPIGDKAKEKPKNWIEGEIERIKKLHRQRSSKRQNTNLTFPNINCEYQEFEVDGVKYKLPQNYFLSENQIYTLAGKFYKLVSSSKIIISEIFKNNNIVYVNIKCSEEGNSITKIVDKFTISSKKNIVSLSNYGFPFNDNNAKYIIDYFGKFIDTNKDVIPIKKLSSNLGWVEGMNQFFWGKNCIKGNEDTDVIDFMPSDSATECLANGFYCHETQDTWMETINTLVSYPKIMMMLGASFAAPLIKIVGLNSFIIDLSDESSTGKTISLRVAASIWGNPSSTSSNSIVRPWNTTETGLERTLSCLSNLPLFIDDTKLCGSANDNSYVSKFIYMISENSGKTRGAIDGMRHTSHWNTVVLSTGEQKITDFYKADGGAQERVLVLSGSPFESLRDASFVTNIDSNVKSNYGHAGPLFIAHLLKHKGKWDGYRNRYNDIKKSLIDHVSKQSFDSNKISRLIEYIAVIQLALEIANEAMPSLSFNTQLTSVVKSYVNDLASLTKENDTFLQVLEHVISYVSTNQNNFPRKGQCSNLNIESFGYIDDKNHELIFVGAKLTKVIEDQKHSPESIKKAWIKRNYFKIFNNKSTTSKKLALR